jgi:lysozyme family protein
MSSFDSAFDALMDREGGYSNNPDDPGGETMFGITERVARRFGYTGSMRMLPRVTAKAIARQEYWDRARCDEMEPRVAFQIFDTIFNGGPAIKWLQMSVDAAPDGRIGPATLAALKLVDPVKVVMRFNAYRLMYLAGLKTFPTFGHGWANRIAANLLKGGA